MLNMICRDLRVCITDLEDEEFNKIDGEWVIFIESKSSLEGEKEGIMETPSQLSENFSFLFHHP